MWKLIVLLLCISISVESANILGLFVVPSKSHHILGSTLLKALAKKGHKVTMISYFPLKTKVNNYEDIVLNMPEQITDQKEMMMNHVFNSKQISYVENLISISKHLSMFNKNFLEEPQAKDLLASNRTFDVVIQCWTMNPSHFGIANHFGASHILFSTLGSTIFSSRLSRNPTPPSYVPNIFLELPQNMTFMQRVYNTLANVAFEVLFAIHMRFEEQLMREHFPNAPTQNELFANISLILMNSHYSIETPRPYQPNMIRVGGFHVQEGKGLTKDLQEFMDSAKEGVIFFSLGSNMKSAYLPKEIIQVIVNTFAKFPLKFLWKFEDDNVPNLPANVKIGKWLPQSDILAHPNTKAFITHGGLLSTTEAIYHGVPMVGIPLFGDQQANVFEAVSGGYTIKLEFLDITEETFTKAISEILTNPSYRQIAQRQSKIMKDQPLKPLDNAVYWVEYVLRHQGAHHLQSYANKLSWCQYNLIDVWLFLTGILLTTFLIAFYFIFKFVQLVKFLLYGKSKKGAPTSSKTTGLKKKKKLA